MQFSRNIYFSGLSIVASSPTGSGGRSCVMRACVARVARVITGRRAEACAGHRGNSTERRASWVPRCGSPLSCNARSCSASLGKPPREKAPLGQAAVRLRLPATCASAVLREGEQPRRMLGGLAGSSLGAVRSVCARDGADALVETSVLAPSEEA